MNIILLMGRAGSKSIPSKNVYPILGRPLAYYPMAAALKSRRADQVYVSTDCPHLVQVARDLGVHIICRPEQLSGDTSEMTDVIVHALGTIKEPVQYLITMHCNCVAHSDGLIDRCVDLVDQHPEADSCVTGYIDKTVHPYRTKRVDQDGFLHPWLDVPEGTSNNRQALSPCFILDGAVRVLRVERCLPPNGQRPFTYLGNRILHVENAGRGDIHGPEDLIAAEGVLRAAGWTEASRA